MENLENAEKMLHECKNSGLDRAKLFLFHQLEVQLHLSIREAFEHRSDVIMWFDLLNLSQTEVRTMLDLEDKAFLEVQFEKVFN